MTMALQDAATRTIPVKDTRIVYRELGERGGVPAVFLQAQLTAIAKWGQAPNSSERLKQVRLPVPVANGDANVMVPTPNSIALFNALPSARLSIFPDASHGGIFQYADTFVDQTLGFLAE
jgi:pimeloyl-ACP methyl ester carboxylesterase